MNIRTIKGVHNTFELWAPFIFWVKVLACGHSAAPSATTGGILGVVGWASKNLLNDGFYAAKSTKQGENGQNLRLFVVFDYATWPGSASSVACDLALRARSLVCYSAGVHAELNAMFHSDQNRRFNRTSDFLLFHRKISWHLAFSQYKEWASSSLLWGLNKPIFRLWPHVWPLAEIFALFLAIKSAKFAPSFSREGANFVNPVSHLRLSFL